MCCRTTSSNFSIGHGHYNRSSVFSIQSHLNTSLRPSSPGRSGGGAGKGREACNYVSGIWIPASKSRCKMVIGIDDISNVVITLMFAYIRADWRKSDHSVDGEQQGNWKRNLNYRGSCKLSFLFAPEELARRLFRFKCVTSQKTVYVGGYIRMKLWQVPHQTHWSNQIQMMIYHEAQ